MWIATKICGSYSLCFTYSFRPLGFFIPSKFRPRPYPCTFEIWRTDTATESELQQFLIDSDPDGSPIFTGRGRGRGRRELQKEAWYIRTLLTDYKGQKGREKGDGRHKARWCARGTWRACSRTTCWRTSSADCRLEASPFPALVARAHRQPRHPARGYPPAVTGAGLVLSYNEVEYAEIFARPSVDQGDY
jgi:hypothetical protein